ncbi:hypothetical protein ACFLUO_01260 [Chloroflexota bacterium]
MTKVTKKTKWPCKKTFPCFFRGNGLCTFRIQAETTLEYLAEKDPENREIYRRMLDVISLPCLELSEEECQLGVGNTLLGIGNPLDCHHDAM